MNTAQALVAFFVLFLIVHYVYAENNFDWDKMSFEGYFASAEKYLLCGLIAAALLDLGNQFLLNKPYVFVDVKGKTQTQTQ